MTSFGDKKWLAMAAFILSSPVSSCPFSKSNLPSPHAGHLRRKLTTTYTPGVCELTNGAAPTVSRSGICEAYSGIYDDFRDVLPTDEVELSTFYGVSLRLAFHDAGEVDVGSSDLMGPDGCLSSSGDNAGLVEDSSDVFTKLEPIWQKYCDKMSRADFWALMGKLVVEHAADDNIEISYQYGRTDNADCSAGSGRLPSAQVGLDGVEAFFAQMGLSLAEGATLLGGHVLGHVHTNHSGYGFNSSMVEKGAKNVVNAWSLTPTVFDAGYYRNLLRTEWLNMKPNEASKDLWANTDFTVMLNPDMVLAFDITLDGSDVGTFHQACGPDAGGTGPGCTNPEARGVPSVTILNQIKGYENNDAAFLSDFADAYVAMVTAGYGIPATTDGATASGKLGTVTTIDLSTCGADDGDADDDIENEGDQAVDYSCLHKNAWHTSSDYSTLFGASTGVQTSEAGDYSTSSGTGGGGGDDAMPPPMDDAMPPPMDDAMPPPPMDDAMPPPPMDDAMPPPPPKRAPGPATRRSKKVAGGSSVNRALQADTEAATGWNIEYTGIPQYDHTISTEEVAWLNNRPKASSDFSSGATSATANSVIEFGENIGYSTGSCSMGYWPPGPGCPTADDRTASFPLSPAPETLSSGCFATSGTLGVMLNGVSLFGWSDTTSYNSESVWHPTAMAFELYDLDICWGHAAGGNYHHHSYSPCFAEVLADDGSKHSPLWGFILDGYPIYGPYDGAGELAESCWLPRDYSTDSETGCGADNVRNCVMTDPWDVSAGTTAVSSGPNTDATTSTQSSNTIDAVSGVYFEDYYYNSSCTKQGQKYLDSFNGHNHGNYGYHYHFTLSSAAMEADGTALPTFPYIIGPKYYGCRAGATCCTGPSAGACNEMSASPTTGTSMCGNSLASNSFACDSINDDFYSDDAVNDDGPVDDAVDDSYGNDDDDDGSGAAATSSRSFAFFAAVAAVAITSLCFL